MNATVTPSLRFREILVATDFSDLSREALQLSKSIARRFHSGIMAVHVSEPMNPITVPEGQWFYSEEDLHIAEKTMEELRESLSAEGFPTQVSCPVGPVAREIERTARNCKADLLVLGTHAWRGAKRWLFGSVAESVAHNLNLPLLLIGPHAAERSFGESWKVKRVLCASPMDAEGKAVALYANALAQEMGAQWQMACDYLSKDPGCADWESFYEDLEHDLAAGDEADGSIQTVLLTKPYPEQLAELARLRSADLIVVGHSQQFMDWSMIRSGTLPHLLAHASCPVLVVPTHQQKKG
ncbi:universal stress protein [Silvibacterium acidisoli]|uniref:universal stress protein n=1 Tax=Acidobacteriaceae bacterium ZG23-2 TaxID=2883246 RepID=UPI00406C764A